MQKTALCIAFSIAVCILLRGPACSFEVGTDLPVNSKYMWRGIELNKEAVFQPDVWIRHKGVTLTAWGNMELSSVHNGHRENGEAGDFTELNYILAYEGSFRKFTCGAGYIYYEYPHTAYAWTHELFISLGYAMPLSPTLSVFRDFRAADGWYATFSVHHETPLPAFFNSTLITGAVIGFSSSNHSKSYYGLSKSVFSDSLVSTGLELPLAKNIALTPSMYYSAFLDGSVRNKRLNRHNDTVWFGVKLSFSHDL